MLVTILDHGIAVYADQDGMEIDASDADNLIVITAKNIAVKNEPEVLCAMVPPTQREWQGCACG